MVPAAYTPYKTALLQNALGLEFRKGTMVKNKDSGRTWWLFNPKVRRDELIDDCIEKLKTQDLETVRNNRPVSKSKQVVISASLLSHLSEYAASTLSIDTMEGNPDTWSYGWVVFIQVQSLRYEVRSTLAEHYCLSIQTSQIPLWHFPILVGPAIQLINTTAALYSLYWNLNPWIQTSFCRIYRNHNCIWNNHTFWRKATKYYNLGACTGKLGLAT